MLPPRLGRFAVRAKIGDGGMATVYLGRPMSPAPPTSPLGGPNGASANGNANANARNPSVVALKVIKEEFCKQPEFVAMFLDEAKIISRLSHPNLVEVVELGSEGDRFFIAMELLVGQSLWEVWNACRVRGVRLRYDIIAWVGARVAEGLHHAHEMRDPNGQPQLLVHRDVNQSNIFLTYDGQVKVIDFGLAKARGRAYETAGGVVKGKIAYLAPEQVAGHPIDRRADIFALGTTLWELTTDRRLFRAKDDAETLQRIYSAEVPDPLTLVHGFPPALWNVLRRALARTAAGRYPTALEFARALDLFATSEGRIVDARAVSDVMRELFSMEYVRDQEWLAEASSADRPAPRSTMHPTPALTLPPPAEDTVEDLAPPSAAGDVPPSSGWPRGAPPDGMFSPAPSRPAPQAAAAADGASLAKDQTAGATAFALAPLQPPENGHSSSAPPAAVAEPVPNPLAGVKKAAAVWAFVVLLLTAAGIGAALALRH
jgi:serine/threonine protein kinase